MTGRLEREETQCRLSYNWWASIDRVSEEYKVVAFDLLLFAVVRIDYVVLWRAAWRGAVRHHHLLSFYRIVTRVLLVFSFVPPETTTQKLGKMFFHGWGSHTCFCNLKHFTFDGDKSSLSGRRKAKCLATFSVQQKLANANTESGKCVKTGPIGFANNHP